MWRKAMFRVFACLFMSTLIALATFLAANGSIRGPAASIHSANAP